MTSKRITAATFAALLAMGAALGARASGAHHGNDKDDVAAASSARITLGEAVSIAERQTGAKAIEAGIESRNGAVAFEVKVAKDNAVQKVMVDAQNGRVIGVSAAEGHGGDGDGEEDDD